MVNELLITIGILSSCLESNNFQVRDTAKENLIEINNVFDISWAINGSSLEMEWAKSQIIERSYDHWFSNLKTKGLYSFDTEDRIQPMWNDAVQIYSECYVYQNFDYNHSPAMKSAINFYFRSLIQNGYSKRQIEEMIKRQFQ